MIKMCNILFKKKISNIYQKNIFFSEDFTLTGLRVPSQFHCFEFYFKFIHLIN